MASPRTRVGAAIRRVSVESRIALGLGVGIGLLLVIGLTGCASTIGDMRGNIALASNIPEPSRPLEPSRPPAPSRPSTFPNVLLIAERTSAKSDTLLASLTAGRPTDAAIEPIPGPKPGEVPSLGIATIPPPPPDQTQAEKTFHEQAGRAVVRIVERDYDDPSICQSLREQVLSNPELARIRPDWEQPLADAIARAKVLQQLSPVLRLLRAAYANSKRDPKGFYRDIDQPVCRQAFVLLFDVSLDAVEVPVTISPLERMKLRDIESLCRDSHDAVLSERIFPNSAGAQALRKLVRKMFMTTYPGASVNRVVIKDGWREVDGGRRRVLRAVVGVKRENAFPNDPCTMEEVSVSQTKSGRKFEATECCDIHSSVAITCDQIEYTP